jgi:hypothetical protein
MRQIIIVTMVILFIYGSRASTEIVDEDSVAANDGGLEVEKGNSDFRPRHDNDNDIISVGTSQLRRASRMELTAKMNRVGGKGVDGT